MIRGEVLKRKIENKVTKNVDTHINDSPCIVMTTILNHIIETPKIFKKFHKYRNNENNIRNSLLGYVRSLC